MRTERIANRLVSYEVAHVEGVGWVSVAVVRQGLAHERGRVFRAVAANRDLAIMRLFGNVEVELNP